MNADFSKQPWSVRYATLGDEAEEKFMQHHPKGWAPWGLRRPPIRVASLPAKMRYAPDFITSDGFVEAMGVGQKQLLRLKVEKHIALLQWQQEMDTQLFLWDSSRARYCYMSMPVLTDAIALSKPGSFPEGKPTWDIPVKKLDVEWVST